MVKATSRTAPEADKNDPTSPRERSDVLKRVKDRGRLAKRRTNRKKRFIRLKNALEASNSETSDCERFIEASRLSPPSTAAEVGRTIDNSTPVTSTHSERVSLFTKIVALDCEMVATRRGSALAQCTILSYNGEILFHEYVRPPGLIVDYRTRWSGILPHHMKCAIPHKVAVKRIKGILAGKVCVGHDLSQDFSVIGMSYSRNQTRDTARFKPLRTLAGLVSNQHPSLKNLALHLLDRKIQDGCHNSLEDARAALDLYRKHEELWESYLVEQNWDKAVWLQDQYWPQEIVAQC